LDFEILPPELKLPLPPSIPVPPLPKVPTLLNNCASLRVRALGVSFMTNPRNNIPQRRLVRGSIVIIPPAQPSLYDDTSRQVTPIILSAVALCDPYVPVRMVNSGDFINISLEGKWRVLVSDLFGWPSISYEGLTRSSSNLENVNLHISARVKLNREPDRWEKLLPW
jgi:hypothetical protein